MSGPEQPNRVPTWLAPVVLVLLAAQLGLLYVQGLQIHRQREDIRHLRGEVQYMSEVMEQGGPEVDRSSAWNATSRRASRPSPSFQRVILEEDPEPAARDIEASKKEAQKAVSQARDIQQKLSIEENARKAEEKARLLETQNRWQRYMLWALGIGLLAFVVRALIRHRNS